MDLLDQLVLPGLPVQRVLAVLQARSEGLVRPGQAPRRLDLPVLLDLRVRRDLPVQPDLPDHPGLQDLLDRLALPDRPAAGVGRGGAGRSRRRSS